MPNGIPAVGVGKPGKPQQLSPTAGPISAAVGATPPSPGSGAGNFTQGLAPVPTPHMQPLQPGALTNPTSIANMVQGYQNQANKANSQRYGQALGVMGQSQDSTNSLYGAAQGAVTGIGQQALGRINLAEQGNLADVQQSGISRGIGNSTIADTMQYMPKRLAEDERQGVNEMQAKLQSGLDVQQAGSQQQFGQSIAGLIGSRNDQAPSIGEYAGLAHEAAAGGNGRPFPQRSGSLDGGGGSFGADNAPMNSPIKAGALPNPNNYIDMRQFQPQGTTTAGGLGGSSGGLDQSGVYPGSGVQRTFFGNGSQSAFSPGDPMGGAGGGAGGGNGQQFDYGGEMSAAGAGGGGPIADASQMDPETLRRIYGFLGPGSGAGGGGDFSDQG